MNCSLKFSQHVLLSVNKWAALSHFLEGNGAFKFPRLLGLQLDLSDRSFFWNVYLGLLTCIIKFSISAVLVIGHY